MLDLFKVSAKELSLTAIRAFALQASFNSGPFGDMGLITHSYSLATLDMKTNATLLTSHSKAHSQHALFERGLHARPGHRLKFWS